jgi:hypothetical protein
LLVVVLVGEKTINLVVVAVVVRVVYSQDFLV